MANFDEIIPPNDAVLEKRILLLLSFGATARTLGYTATSLSAFRVRVDFSVPVIDNDALRAPENYKITLVADPLTRLQVFSISPEAVAEPTYAILETSEQKGGVNNYNFQIENVEPA